MRSWSLRARLTLVTTGLAALSLVAGAILLVVALDRALLGNLDDSGRQRAREIAALLGSDSLPDGPLQIGAGTVAVQVLAPDGSVARASVGGDSIVPLVPPGELLAVRAGAVVELPGSRVGVPDDLRLVGATAGSRSVLVAVSAAQAHASLRLVVRALLLLVPLALLVFAVVSRALVGLALRPVEALRRGADEITGTRRSAALPVPPGDDEVHRLAVTLNSMIARLESASARQRSFVADAAHELRSPLATIRTAVEVTLAHPKAAPWDETAPDVLAEVARMTRLVEDLLLLARMEQAQRPGAIPLVELAQVLGPAAPGGSRVPVQVSVPAGLLVRADPDDLRRIVRNLTDNALRHATTGVLLEARREGSEVVVTVTDDGSGVPEDMRERVFARFARLDEARSRDAGGSGLGLAIVRELTTAYHGTVHLEDAAPGVRAVVRLPAAPAQEALPPAD